MKAKQIFGALAMAAVLLCSCEKEDEKSDELNDYVQLESINIDLTSTNHYVIGIHSKTWSGQVHVDAPELQDYTGSAVNWQSDGYPYQPKAGDYPFGINVTDTLNPVFNASFVYMENQKFESYRVTGGKATISYPSAGQISLIIDAKAIAMDGSEVKDIKFKYVGTYSVNAKYKAELKDLSRVGDDGNAHQYSIQIGVGDYVLQFLVKAKSGEYYLPSAGQPDVPYGFNFTTIKGNLEVQRALKDSQSIDMESAWLQIFLQNDCEILVIDGSFTPVDGYIVQFRLETDRF